MKNGDDNNSDLIISSARSDYVKKLERMCRSYNQYISNNSFSDTDEAKITVALIGFHQHLREIDSFKSHHNRYKSITSMTHQLHTIILHYVCGGDENQFTLNYNQLYNHIQLCRRLSSQN